MNCGSVDSLKVSTRCGLSPKARQIRLIADCDMPSLRARLRVDSGWHRSEWSPSHDQHPFDPFVADRAWRPRPWLINQSVQPVGHKPRPPLGHRGAGHAQLPSDLAVGDALRAGQHDPARNANAWALLGRLAQRCSVDRSWAASTSGACNGPRRRTAMGVVTGSMAGTY
jgi:hypothetical protein